MTNNVPQRTICDTLYFKRKVKNGFLYKSKQGEYLFLFEKFRESSRVGTVFLNRRVLTNLFGNAGIDFKTLFGDRKNGNKQLVFNRAGPLKIIIKTKPVINQSQVRGDNYVRQQQNNTNTQKQTI